MTRVGNRAGSETLQVLCVVKQQSIHAVKREKQDSELGSVAMSFAGPNAGHGDGLSVVISKSGLQIVSWWTAMFQVFSSCAFIPEEFKIKTNLIPEKLEIIRVFPANV